MKFAIRFLDEAAAEKWPGYDQNTYASEFNAKGFTIDEDLCPSNNGCGLWACQDDGTPLACLGTDLGEDKSLSRSLRWVAESLEKTWEIAYAEDYEQANHDRGNSL